VRNRHSTNLIARSTWIIAFSVAALAVISAVGGGSTGTQAANLGLRVAPVPLEPTDPSREAVGPLRYAGGLWLSSDDPRFGGISDLRVSPDGLRLWAVSDCGRGFTARLSYDAGGRLQGLADARLHDLAGPTGEALRLGENDSESLAIDGDRIEVGFEGKDRIWSYALEPPFSGPAQPVLTPAGLRACGPNGGIEAMTRLPGNRRLLACEDLRAAAAEVPAWVGAGSSWSERSYPLHFAGGWAAEPFRPTAAAPLPGGDVLVLERRFPPLGARIVRLTATDLAGTGALHPREIARLEAPLTIDNFEGIASREDAAGHTLVYLSSDDNNCAKSVGGTRGTGLQRTLLMMFRLDSGA
jgi:hypothetical protein